MLSNYKNLIIIVIILLFLAAFAITVGVLVYKNKKLVAELDLVTIKYNTSQIVLEQQNNAIAAAKIDQDNYTKTIAELQTKAQTTRVEVVTKLLKDSSCEAELAIVQEQLGRLYEMFNATDNSTVNATM